MGSALFAGEQHAAVHRRVAAEGLEDLIGTATGQELQLLIGKPRFVLERRRVVLEAAPQRRVDRELGHEVRNDLAPLRHCDVLLSNYTSLIACRSRVSIS